MPPKTIKLKRGILQYDGNGAWRRNGRLLNDTQRRRYKFVDRGYWKGLSVDGGTPVLDLDKEGRANKLTYISNREDFWKNSPIIRHAVDSIAQERKVNPYLVKNRLDHEGLVDYLINNNNKIFINDIQPLLKSKDEWDKGDAENMRRDPIYRRNSNYLLLNGIGTSYGTREYGLDTTGENIRKGNITPSKATNYTFVKSNKGDNMGVNGLTTKDNISLIADHLKYLTNVAKEKHPGFNAYLQDVYANGMYREGPSTVYFKSNPNGGKYKFEGAGRTKFACGGKRKKAWIGAAIGAGTSILGSIIGANAQSKAQETAKKEANRNNALSLIADLNNTVNTNGDENMNDRLMYMCGGNVRRKAKYGCKKRC